MKTTWLKRTVVVGVALLFGLTASLGAQEESSGGDFSEGFSMDESPGDGDFSEGFGVE